VPAGAEVCFVTDGLLEARSQVERMLGREGLVRLLTESPRPLAADAVLERVTAIAAPADDLTACVLRPLAAAGDGSVVEEVDLEPGEPDRRLGEYLAGCDLDATQCKRVLAAVGRGATGLRLRLRRGTAGLAGWEILGSDERGDGVAVTPLDRFEASSERVRGNGHGASAADHGAERARDGAALGRASRA
jgi:hypothetical protein